VINVVTPRDGRNLDPPARTAYRERSTWAEVRAAGGALLVRRQVRQPRAVYGALAIGIFVLASAAWVSPAAAQAPPEAQPPGTQPPAEQPPGTTPPPPERAKTLAQEGAKLAGAGQYKEACSKFQQSILVHPMTDVYFNLGYCYEQVGNWKGCVENYQQYIDRFKKSHDGAEPPDIIGVKRSIEKCTEIAQPPISISSTPVGAQVAIGEATKVIGATPLTQKFKPGTYKVFISKEGFTTVEREIVVQPKQAGKFHFDLRKEVKSGRVRIRVNVRDATIYIDGKNYGLSPYRETPELPLGSHQVVVKKDRYTTVNRTFEIVDGSETVLDYDLVLVDPPSSWRSYLGWASVSIGAVAIAGGVVAFQFAEQEFSDTDDFKQLELLQNVGYGVGGGLMGVGISLLIWEAFADSVDSNDLITDEEQAVLTPAGFGITPVDGGVFMQGAVKF
jgi:hypothetical protein